MGYTYYVTPDKFEKVLDTIKNDFVFSLPDKQKKIQYLKQAVSFDTETTSFKMGKKKYATMYAWGFDIGDITIIGRTWNEFIKCMDILANKLKLNDKKRVIIYVHNLSYEFQFMHKWFQWEKVFAIKSRTVLFAITETGIEFRCSYLLSALSLKNLAKSMNDENSIHMEKLDYNYTEIRHSQTKLNQDEIEYLIHDCKIVSKYIRKCIKDENGIQFIPLTKTGYVRRLVRTRCYQNAFYRDFIIDLYLNPHEYRTANDAFSGGFTHSNPIRTGVLLKNVSSYDITSSYPTVMITEKYPMKSGVYKTDLSKEEFYKLVYNENYFCTFSICIKNVSATFLYDFYLSSSRCYEKIKPQISNGRIVTADSLCLTITNIDFQILEKCYKFDIDSYENFYLYETDYLPREIIIAILDLYEGKTILKDVDGKEDEYLMLKGMLNSVYGMCVTDIIRDLNEYNYDERKWKPTKPALKWTYEEKQKAINKANTEKGRFLYYLWGVAVTAYARKNLWCAILECGADYCYSDTDSVKFLHMKKHEKWFISYNEEIKMKIKCTLNHYNIDAEKANPKNKFGKIKPLGIWTYEGTYTHFKTLGAKRYLYRTPDGYFHLTCAGVSKKSGCDYLIKQSKLKQGIQCIYNDENEIKSVFDLFHFGFEIPAEYTGKQTLYYNDDEFSCELIDRDNVSYTVHEYSCIYMENADFCTDEVKQFQEFIKCFKYDIMK